MLLALGIVHGELTSLLWGGAFGFVWTVVALVGAVSGWRLRRSLPQAHIEISERPPTLFFRSDTLPMTPPLFSWRLRVVGRHSAERTFTEVLPSSATEYQAYWPRGRYQVTARWELADWFGFTRLTVPARDHAVLTIEPFASAFVPPFPLPDRRRGSFRIRKAGQRTGEPFDVRHYVPGDDLRRLHWPLYAHSDNLFVRTPEPEPPPLGHQFIVLDINTVSEAALDARLGDIAGWLGALDAQGADWTVTVPATGLKLRPKDGIAALAALSPSPVQLALDPNWPEALFLMSGKDGAKTLFHELIQSKRSILYIQVPDNTVRALERPWWSRG
jgi:hypothetical protein